MESYVIYPDGSTQPAMPKRTRPSDDGRFSITQLQDIVDGYINIIDVPEGTLIYDDEGDVKDKPINRKATEIAMENEEFRNRRRHIAGAALMCGHGMIRP